MIAAASPMLAQRMTVFGIDTTTFPQMSAELVISDPGGIPIFGYSSEDFVVTEDGEPVDGVVVSCPTPKPASPASFVLVTDKSGSMGAPTVPGRSRLAVVQDALRSFVGSVQFVGPTSVALTSFDGMATVETDFQRSTLPLLAAIDAMRLGGLTNYNAALLDPFAGGIPLLMTRPDSIPRILIFLTDGTEELGNYAQALAAAHAGGIRIFVITVGMTMPDVLQSLANETGGMAFGNVNDPEQLSALYTMIAVRSQSTPPCRLTWQSRVRCGYSSRFRELKVELKPLHLVARADYTAPESAIYGLDAAPRFLWFGEIGPGDSATLPLTLTARSGDATISPAALPPGSPFTVINWGGSAPPFILRAGTSRTITIRFKPADSTISTQSLTLGNDPCTFDPVVLSGGVRGSGVHPALTLLAPIGGEAFSECDSVVIRWSGTSITEKVKLEYSINNGITWKTIADNVTGSMYVWTPPGAGTNYRVKVSLHEMGNDSIATFAGGGSMDVDDIPPTDALLFSPKGVAVNGNLVYFSESGAHRVRSVDVTRDLISTIAGTGTSGNADGIKATIAQLYNPSGMCFSGSMLYIADYSNQKLRMLDMTTGILTTIAGNGQAGVSGDGGPGKNARLSSPTDVAISGSMVYIADQANGRVRAVDMTTGLITTIAGGGDYPVADGGPAAKSLLMAPSALAIDGDSLYIAEEDGHRVRRIDLRTGAMYTSAGDGMQGASAEGLRADSSQLNSPTGLAIAGNYLMISEKGNNRIRAVDRRTKRIRTIAGTGIAGYSGDGGLPLKAQLNAPARIATGENRLFVAEPLNNRVRVITFGSAGRTDSSRKPFTVAAAQLSIGPAGKSVNLGAMAAGGERDSVIAGVLCNRGNIPLHVDSALIVGANPGDFLLISGLSSSPIAPGDCRPVEIRFRPQGTGIRTASMIFHGRCCAPDTLQLSGTGTTPCGQRVISIAELGETVAGTPRRDTTLVGAICNTGTTKLDGTIALRDNSGAFTIVSGDGPFSLPPGFCRDIVVRFFPSLPGRATAEIDYGLSVSCGVHRTALHGRGLQTEELVIDTLVELHPLLCPSDVRDSFLLLKNLGEAPLVVTGIGIAPADQGISVTSTIPTPVSPLIIPPEGVETVRLRFVGTTPGARSATITVTSASRTLHAIVRGRKDSLRIAPDASRISFTGDLPALSYPHDTTLTIRNTGTVSVTITSGAIDGVDRERFELPAGQLPMTIPPGGSIALHLRALGSATGRGYRARLALASNPACDSAMTVDLAESGAEPALLVPGIVFGDLICTDRKSVDSTITIINSGGSELRITGFRIEGNDAASFTFAPTLPIVIPPGGKSILPIGFAPRTTGMLSARLVLVGNATSGDSIVALSGRREVVSYSASPGSVTIGPIMPGADGTGSVVLKNNGTLTTTLAITSANGGLPPTVTLGPGEELALTVTMRRNAEGVYRDTIFCVDDRCGISSAIAVEATIINPARAVVSLPVDSAATGARVLIPLRIAIPDRPTFNARKASSYRTTITFSGIVLFLDSTRYARTIASTFDPVSALQSVTIEGTYAGTGDTLALLECETLASSVTSTPLHLASFDWDSSGITTEMVDGSFAVSGDCAPGRRLALRPRVLKIVPMPVGGDATIELALDEPVGLRASLVDANGREAALIADRGLPAGTSTLRMQTAGLPSGLYTLRLVTPFGETSVKVMVVK
jgi:hypothetical protein